MKMEQTECSETSAYKIKTAGNYPEESTEYSEHDESLKSRISVSPTKLQIIIPYRSAVINCDNMSIITKLIGLRYTFWSLTGVLISP